MFSAARSGAFLSRAATVTGIDYDPASLSPRAGIAHERSVCVTVQHIGRRFVELCNQGKNFEVMRTMYAPDIVSVEADGSETAGQAAVIQKSERWAAANEIHGEKVRGPYFHGPDSFAVHIAFDVTRKDTGQRTTLEEVAVYTARDGKIVRERFFFEGPW